MWTDLYAEQPAPQAARILSDVELFLRSKRKYLTLMEQYNPLYGMSEQDRIRATARTVGLHVPTAEDRQKHNSSSS